MSSLVCALIERRRIRTTLVKAKQAGRLADRMVTLGRKGTLAARRRALARLRSKKAVTTLFSEIVPLFEGRNGGYTSVLKLGSRSGDGAEMAVLEWVGAGPPPAKKKKKKAEETDRAA